MRLNWLGVAGFEPTNDGVRGLKTNFPTTIYSGHQANNTAISAIFDDFQFFTPILLPNDFMSFGGIFYSNFASLTAQILNDGQKTTFVRHSMPIWEQLPISTTPYSRFLGV